jgi:molybdopterin/thiamine biosynthesis adenylyltransferase
MHEEYSVAIPVAVENRLRTHLVRADGQEDLVFALWAPSEGISRLSALIHTPLTPDAGDRDVHGNASFQPQYFERACREALRTGCGLAFLHSHPYPGWQGMSYDDVRAERGMAPAVSALTGLPLVGLTVGSDGTWSARMWVHQAGRAYERIWCASVRTVGKRLGTDFASDVLPRPAFRPMFKRTITVWGEDAHADLARLRVGIVGLGSVGALVCEALARMGLQRFVFIDFDVVEAHNLDRLVTASEGDVGRRKVDVAADRMRLVATAATVNIRAAPYSVVEELGYRAALDCDVLFSCVDRPRARHVLNHMAYRHLIPVIDGGIQVRFREGRFTGVDWQVHTVGVDHECLECLGAYDPGDVSTEAAGKLDDPSYLQGLHTDHHFKRNENVFPFAANLASLEVLHLIATATGAAGIDDFGVQRYRYVPGIIEQLPPGACRAACPQPLSVARGDTDYSLIGRDLAAERSRNGGPVFPTESDRVLRVLKADDQEQQ